jgi:hypothetical protein
MATPLAPETPSLDTFGAPYEDADSTVDPETEMAAEYMNRLVAQVAMLSHTAPKAWARFTISGSTATCVAHNAVWGDTNAVKPTATRVMVGQWGVAWAASYDDLQSTPESHSVSIGACHVEPYGNVVYHNSKPNTANTVTALFYNAAGTLTDPTDFAVWIY